MDTRLDYISKSKMFLPSEEDTVFKKGDLIYVQGTSFDIGPITVPVLRADADVKDIKEIFQISPYKIKLFTFNKRVENQIEDFKKAIRKSIVGTEKIVGLDMLLDNPSLYIVDGFTYDEHKNIYLIKCKGWDCINRKTFYITVCTVSTIVEALNIIKDLNNSFIHMTARANIGKYPLPYEIERQVLPLINI